MYRILRRKAGDAGDAAIRFASELIRTLTPRARRP
jgi:hypothetical protein